MYAGTGNGITRSYHPGVHLHKTVAFMAGQWESFGERLRGRMIQDRLYFDSETRKTGMEMKMKQEKKALKSWICVIKMIKLCQHGIVIP